MSDKLFLADVPYDYEELSPVMSKETLKYHRDSLASGYVEKYNNKEGDSKFNEAGAYLHNIFFPQLKKPSGSNKPNGNILNFIESNYNSFDNFKQEFKKIAMSVQGSGWVYLDRSGDIKIIKNHKKVTNIVLLVDWWEHAWALDYQSKKDKYLENIWKIIDWRVISERIRIDKSSKKNTGLSKIHKLANSLYSMGFHAEAEVVEKLTKT